MFSNCPSQGARIVSTILNDPILYREWYILLFCFFFFFFFFESKKMNLKIFFKKRESNVKQMAERIKLMRKALYDALIQQKTPGKWDHIVNQIGMFTFTGLTSKFHLNLLFFFSFFFLNFFFIIIMLNIFSHTSIAKQCEALMSEHHVYLTKNGRISLAGLTPDNVGFVANGIHNVVINIK